MVSSENSSVLNKLVLGTVQLGLPYGVNNSIGQPTLQEACSLLQLAYERGIRYLDTAEAYGNSQSVIGTYHSKHKAESFSVITKYSGQQSGADGNNFKSHFLKNLDTLSISSLDAYLFHNFDVYRNFEYWGVLETLVKENYLKQIGVSVYTNEQALAASSDERISVVQLPFNLLDNFNRRGEVLQTLKQKGKEVHIRSVFLQGLFYKNRHNLGKLSPLKENLLQLDSLAQSYNVSIGTLALAYCLKQPCIDKVLIGVETKSQLLDNTRMAIEVNNVDDGMFSTIDAIETAVPHLLNPVNWQ